MCILTLNLFCVLLWHKYQTSRSDLTATVLLSFLDRSNIGNARIAGMEDDLDLTGDRYDWLLTIFYISYILFQFQVKIYLIPRSSLADPSHRDSCGRSCRTLILQLRDLLR